MLELEGVLGISYSNFSILLMKRKDSSKEKRFIGGKVKTLYFQPRAHSPLLHYWQESEIEVSTEDSRRQVNSLNIWQCSQKDRQ